jgi:hypothetical protein
MIDNDQNNSRAYSASQLDQPNSVLFKIFWTYPKTSQNDFGKGLTEAFIMHRYSSYIRISCFQIQNLLGMWNSTSRILKKKRFCVKKVHNLIPCHTWFHMLIYVLYIYLGVILFK